MREVKSAIVGHCPVAMVASYGSSLGWITHGNRVRLADSQGESEMPNKRRRRIELNAKYVREILDYDPNTGIFRWRPRATFSIGWSTRWQGAVAGWVIRGHLQIQIDGANYYAHRVAWLHHDGAWPDGQLNHRNGVRGDNRIANLRIADGSQNSCNKAMQRNNVSGYIGVHFNAQNGRWRATINKNKKRFDVGFFDSAEDAAAAREKEDKRLHGEFAAETRIANYSSSHD